MNRRKMLVRSVQQFAGCVAAGGLGVSAQHVAGRVVRLAELEIDPAQLAAYKVELEEEIEASLRKEPGVLALNAVALKDEPNQIRILETYASGDAYRAHLESAHFKKYKAATAGMVKALRLYEAEAIG